MRNYKTKAEKFSDVFRLMDGFRTMNVYWLPSNKGNVCECFTENEEELYNLLWDENFEINRERLKSNFLKGNDKKYDNLIKEAFNLIEKAFKEYISDEEGNISLYNHVEYSLDEKLKKIDSLRVSLQNTPEYSGEFYNIGTDIHLNEIGTVQKIKPKFSDSGYITNRTGSIEFKLKSNDNLEEGLYIFPEFNNLRFDLINEGYFDNSLTLSINIDTELERKFIDLMKVYIEDFDSQLDDYNNPGEDTRYSVYDVYSMRELL